MGSVYAIANQKGGHGGKATVRTRMNTSSFHLMREFVPEPFDRERLR